MIRALSAALALTLASAGLAAAQPASQVIASAEGQRALLQSPSAQLAANKQLVYDMYREIVQGGHAELVEKYFTPEYIQHNPNVASGREALAAYLRGSRPARPIQPIITLPIIDLIAERDRVLVVSERREVDDQGEPYVTTWFDYYRVENGKIAEHWDPAPKTSAMTKFDPNVSTSLRPR
jgi:predicted SnoaL-like aldol condensation-catalyzing enzyme